VTGYGDLGVTAPLKRERWCFNCLMCCRSAEEVVCNASVTGLGIVTDGFTIEHAFEMAAEAISLRVALERKSGEKLTVEYQPAQIRLVAG
jgi:hypothetical protein